LLTSIEGELFALSDATMAENSQSWPKKLVPPLSLRSYNKTVLLTYISDSSDSIERLFQDLERTWYEKIQWSPEDEYGGISGPVKIAILDTGIDLDHEDFKYPAKRRSKVGQRISTKLAERPQRERIIAWRNFIGDPGEEEDVRDTVGHGTHIAGMLLSIAPRAQLYIAKTSSDGTVAKAGKDSGYAKTRRKGRRPVQEAMRWAIDQGVDIINLSLGFPYESSFELTEALEDANHKGIIVFAAAANHGNREAISWPARDRDLAICVTSGDDQNRLSRFAPSGNTELPVFITHGEDVYSQWPTNLGGGFRTMTGTSVSTPIAVGMAAMILAFLNTTSHWSQEVKREWLDRSKERRLRSTRGMGRLLEQICRDRNGLRVLSPKLMWEDNPNANPFQVLNIISQAFRLPG
jgi:subtilisin family serine protease